MKTLLWVIAEVVIIFVLLSLPGNNFGDHSSWFKEFPVDKLVHMILFGSLALSIFFYFEASTLIILKSIRAKALALIVCIVYGIAMEYYQKYFVPSRGFEVADMLADAAGALIALPLFNIFKNKFLK